MNGFAMKKTKTQTTKTNQSAAECYAARFAECQDLLKRIGGRLEQHRKEQAQTPRHWTHAGDLGHVAQELAYVLAALGDRSAVDAKGLDY